MVLRRLHSAVVLNKLRRSEGGRGEGREEGKEKCWVRFYFLKMFLLNKTKHGLNAYNYTLWSLE